MTSSRADVFLVEQGYAKSRAEARAAIEAGHVFDGARRIAKPSQPLDKTAQIRYAPAHAYVSRGALKLIAALDRFALTPAARICLDIGASTGGFTQVLLERGAAQVFAVDVGHSQLHADLKSDARVIRLEGINARELSAREIPEKPSAIVADVSFISLKLALPPALELAASSAWLVALVKPQFEVGREGVARGGIVRDAALREKAFADIAAWINSVHEWSVFGTMESPIAGGDGNVEYLLAACKS